MTVIGWQAAAASVGFLAGGLIQGVAVMSNQNYEPKPWETTLLLWAAIALAVFFNTVVNAALPKVEGFILIIHILGIFAIIVPLVYLSPHRSANEVFTIFLNEGGWPTQGLSFMLGMIACVYSFLGMETIFLLLPPQTILV